MKTDSESKLVVVFERHDGFSVPMNIRSEVAKLLNLNEGETISRGFANQVRDAAHYYEIGRNDAILEVLGRMSAPVAVVEH